MNKAGKFLVGLGVVGGVFGLIYALSHKAKAAPTPTPTPTPTPPPAGLANLYGKVLDSVSGQAIADATVTLDSLSAISDAGGNYQFLDLTPGPYTIESSATGYDSASATVTLAEGNNQYNLVLTAQTTVSSISGQVTDAATGQGIAGAKAAILGTAITTTSDQNGYYQFPNLAVAIGDTYVITVEAAGYEAGTATVKITGTDNTLDFALEAVGQYPPTPAGTMQIKSVKVRTTSSAIECEFVVDNQTGQPQYQNALLPWGVIHANIFSEAVPGYGFYLFQMSDAEIVPMGLSIWRGQADTYEADVALQLLSGQVSIANFTCIRQPSDTPQSFSGTPGPSWTEWTEIPYTLPPMPPEPPVVIIP